MSDIDTIPAPIPTLADEAFRAALAGYDALNASLRDANKAALLAALAAAGITIVIVAFDGCGDSGQIESVEARVGDDPIDLPDIGVSARVANLGEPAPVKRVIPVAELIERLCYDYLSATHGGWENNDGAYGEFVFDVAAGTITLDHNDRYVAVDSSTHAF